MKYREKILICTCIGFIASAIMVASTWQLEIMIYPNFQKPFSMPFGWVIPVWLAHDIFYTLLYISFFFIAVSMFYLGYTVAKGK